MHRNTYKVFVVYNTTKYLYIHGRHLINELISRGYRVYGLSPKDEYVKYVKQLGVEHIDIRISRSGINPLADFFLILKILIIYKKYKPDIVQHFTIKPIIYGTIAARLTGIKYIYNMIPGLGYVFIGLSPKKFVIRVITEILYRIVLSFSTHVYFQNKDDKDYFVKNKIVKDVKTSVLPGIGVDTQFFTPVEKEKREKIVFILVGRMLWEKGIREFVEAARILKKHKNCAFWLLGPVDPENPSSISINQLKKWQCEGIIEYLGATNDVRKYLEKADIIVLPSYREGTPVSLLEGAAMGMPILTTNAIGCKDTVVDGENGFLIPIKNHKALAEAMEKFILNPHLISQMGKESRKIVVDKFDVKNVVNQILKYYPDSP